MMSLRRRAILGGVLSAFLAVTVGTYVLFSYIDRIVQQRFDNALIDRHTQIVVGLSNTSADPQLLADLIFDPRYQTPFSGRYWQIIGPDEKIYTSPSLFDTVLEAPAGWPNHLVAVDATGPEREPVRSMYQEIVLEDGTKWGVVVAENRTALLAERAQTRRSLMLAFALVGMLGIAGAILQTTTILRPLEQLRKDVANRWKKDENLSASDYPEEVAPFVTDINELLSSNREIIARARRHTADLAHALKTPSAILRNELTQLSERRYDTEKSIDALDRLDAQLQRSLARMRASNSGSSTNARTDLRHSINRLSRFFEVMAERDGKALQTICEVNLSIRIDTQDIEEVIGNLLDNAFKWCRKTVKLSVHDRSDCIELLIEDDGPGIPEKSQRDALRVGGRLDVSKPGTGLGLAIASDLLAAYGADLRLDQSTELGGLAARIILPKQLVSTT